MSRIDQRGRGAICKRELDCREQRRQEVTQQQHRDDFVERLQCFVTVVRRPEHKAQNRQQDAGNDRVVLNQGGIISGGIAGSEDQHAGFFLSEFPPRISTGRRISSHATAGSPMSPNTPCSVKHGLGESGDNPTTPAPHGRTSHRLQWLRPASLESSRPLRPYLDVHRHRHHRCRQQVSRNLKPWLCR